MLRLLPSVVIDVLEVVEVASLEFLERLLRHFHEAPFSLVSRIAFSAQHPESLGDTT